MDRTKVMTLSDKVGGLFRLSVLLQKRVQELVGGAPKLVETRELNPINIALLEIEADAIELVDLSEDELKQLQVESQMASDEAELLEALRSRMTRNMASADNSSSAGGGGYDAGGGGGGGGGGDEDDE
ncbi:MAG TPA: DNA-directed RNA polymerase subunit omega [Planctomycetota bacterium]|nr:DNA-directed RNA polymerase subunit omega [Planctomycetota bacterium]